MNPQDLKKLWKEYAISTLPEPLEDGEELLALSIDYKEAENFWLNVLQQYTKEVVEKISDGNSIGQYYGNPKGEVMIYLDEVLQAIKSFNNE